MYIEFSITKAYFEQAECKCFTESGKVHKRIARFSHDVASDVGVNLCNVKSCLNTSNNVIFTDKRGDLPCVNISKHTCPVVK